MTFHETTKAALAAQHSTVLRCPCGGKFVHDPRPFEWEPHGKCDRCGATFVFEASVCCECSTLFRGFDGPDEPHECPECRKTESCVLCTERCVRPSAGEPPVCESEECRRELRRQLHPEDFYPQEIGDR